MLRGRARLLRAWWQHPDFSIHAAVLTIVALLWGFIELVEVVLTHSQNSLDRKILLLLREPGQPDNPLGPKWLEGGWRDITALGSYMVISLITLLAIGYLLVERKARAAALLLSTALGGWLLSWSFKRAFARPRPDFLSHLVEVSSSSFPSGHSLISAVMYPTLGAMLASLSVHRRTKIYYLSSALLMMLLVGFSRMYLGVHYPSDVLAGWALGLAWALACWLASELLQRRGALHGEHID